MNTALKVLACVMLTYAGVVGEATASPQHVEPTLTTGLTCWPSQFKTKYRGDGISQLNVRPPCTFSRGTIADFGNSHLVFQQDGNLVIYALDNPSSVAWYTGQLFGMYTRIVFQDDGNLVVYNDYDHAAVWSSHTYGACDTDYSKVLTFQKDGNMVIYCMHSDGVKMYALWSSNTWIRE